MKSNTVIPENAKEEVMKLINHQWEDEVFNFIKSLYGTVVRNEKEVEGMKIEIFIPDKNIGFECDGLYSHNELFFDKKYHFKKTQICEANGIRLIHIFEDEWMNRRHVCESRIKNILGMTENKVYARQCEIVEITGKECKEFMNRNHLQGGVYSPINIALKHNGQIVSVMSFGKKRKNLGSVSKEGEYEMLRFANEINYGIVGGASKMLDYFIKTYKPTALTSYCDIRWSDGNLYDKLGFKMDHISEPSYFYVIDGKRKNRFQFRKDVLVSEGYDKSKSEHQIMLDRHIYRVYDCGCKVFTLIG